LEISDSWPIYMTDDPGQPQHHAETQILIDIESAPVPLRQVAHLCDLRRQRLLIQHAVGDIAVIGIHCPKAVAWIRPA
jgi:hypothetical protein